MKKSRKNRVLDMIVLKTVVNMVVNMVMKRIEKVKRRWHKW